MAKPPTACRDVVVVGASAGGLAALIELVRGLPRDLAAAVFVVVHTSPDNPTIMPQILQRLGTLPVKLAEDREAIVPGRIYIAAPDHHLLVKHDHLRVTRGPRENGFRPAIDPLFRTAARAHGPRVIGVVLSGGLNDGTHGLALIVAQGGRAIVQDPEEAVVASMPLSAIQSVEVHSILPAARIGPAIAAYTRETVTPNPSPRDDADEPDIAERGDSLQVHTPPGTQSMFTCPECHGALWELSDATHVLRFRCHVGHGFTAESLLAEQDASLEDTLWSALRSLEEHAALFRRMAIRSEAAGMAATTRKYQENTESAEHHAGALRDLLLKHRPAPVPSDPMPDDDPRV